VLNTQSAGEALLSQISSEVFSLCPRVDESQLRMKLTGILSMYEIRPAQMPGAHPDIQDKVRLFLSAKKLEGLSNLTLESYQLELRIFSEQIQKRVEEITTADIRLFLGEFSELKSSSVSKKLSVLKSFFGWLTAEELIQRDPTRKIKPPKKEKRIPKALNVEELEMTREGCKTLRERALVEVFYSTGCRLSEIRQMNRQDIDWNRRSAKVIGKGNKEREVYFSFKALYHLKKYLKSRDDLVPALFVTERKPIARLSNRAIQREFSKIKELAGVEKNIHPHVMRHTMATLTLNNGADISAVQALLGHENPSTTMNYATITEERKREQHKKYLVQ